MEKPSKFHYPLRHPLPMLYPQKGRMRICYSSWCQRCTRLLPSMGVIGMQDIKAMTILFPCYKNISGGQVWPSR